MPHIQTALAARKFFTQNLSAGVLQTCSPGFVYTQGNQAPTVILNLFFCLLVSILTTELDCDLN